MRLTLQPERLARAKRAFSTRTAPDRALKAIETADLTPRAGDLVLARVLEVGAHQRLELTTSRKALLFEGDEIVLAYGNRYAPDQFEAVTPEDLGPCDLAAAGGIAARVIAKNERMEEPTRIQPVGVFVDEAGAALNLRAFALAAPEAIDAPAMFTVVGGSMNAGKTTTAASIIKGLTRAGYRVGAAKLTGTGAGNDFWHMRDAGAFRVLDFTDVGMATTYRADRGELAHGVRTLIGALAQDGADALVLEVADGLFQEETAWLIASGLLNLPRSGYLYAGESAASCAMGVHWLRQHGRVLGLSGLVSQSPLACREATQATGMRCFTREALASAEVAAALYNALMEQRSQAAA